MAKKLVSIIETHYNKKNTKTAISKRLQERRKQARAKFVARGMSFLD